MIANRLLPREDLLAVALAAGHERYIIRWTDHPGNRALAIEQAVLWAMEPTLLFTMQDANEMIDRVETMP